MKHEKIDVVEVCKELEDLLAPRLKLSVLDRAVYSHLLRHSRFEGKLRLRFSILWLAHNLGITARRTRESVRRLVDKEILRLVERSNIGHVVEVRLPGEVPAARDGRTATGSRAWICAQSSSGSDRRKAPISSSAPFFSAHSMCSWRRTIFKIAGVSCHAARMSGNPGSQPAPTLLRFGSLSHNSFQRVGIGHTLLLSRQYFMR